MFRAKLFKDCYIPIRLRNMDGQKIEKFSEIEKKVKEVMLPIDRLLTGCQCKTMLQLQKKEKPCSKAAIT